MPAVSVIMPAYNCEGFVAEAIESVISQTFEDWELIIVEDCSTDKTGTVIDRFSGGRVVVVKNSSNLGGARSRNKAIGMARGRYIAFLDADDMWDPRKLEIQISFMKERNVGFCFSSYCVVYEKSERVDLIKVPQRVSFSQLLKHNYIGCLTAVYDTLPFGKIYMPVVDKRQDFALWLEILKKFRYAFSVPMPLGFYRVRSGTLSSSKTDALKYYWRVLRQVGGCGMLSAVFNICCYLMIVLIKKRFPDLYSHFVSKSFR